MTPIERIEQFVKDNKKYLNKGVYAPIDGEWPQLYSGYKEAARRRDQIAIHSTRDEFPEKEFRRLMKNMEEQGIEWLKDNYQPITHSVWNTFISTLGRALYNVEFEDRDVDEKVVEYLREEIPKYKSLETYGKQILPKLIALDAMGVFSIVPEAVEVEDVDEETSVIVGDINPMPQYYECWRVIYFNHGNECLVLRHENSMVMSGSTSQPWGLIFDYYSKDKIERYYQTGKYVDYEFSLAMDFPHGLDYMPAWRAGGLAELIDNEVIYQSHFQGAIPHLFEAMNDSVVLNAVKMKCAFPTAVMVVEDCQFTDPYKGVCNSGVLKWMDIDKGEEVIETCPACNGSGTSQKLNPFSTMYVPATNRERQDKYSAQEVLNYVSPDPAIMKFMREEVEFNLSQASAEIFIGRNSSQVDSNVTATEKGIDQKATFAFINSFAMVWISLFNNLTIAATQMKWGKNEPSLVYLKPRDYDLKTTDDYIQEIKAAEDAGVSSVVKAKLISDYLYNSFEGSYVSERIIETIISADRVFQIGDLDAAVMTNNLQPWEITLHLSSYNIVSMLVGRDAEWIDRDIADRIADVQQQAKELTPERTNAAVDALNNLGG